MNYINKNTGGSINQEVYNQLTPSGKNNFIPESGGNVNITNNVSSETTDLLGVGKAVEVVVLTPVVVVGSLFKELFG